MSERKSLFSGKSEQLVLLVVVEGSPCFVRHKDVRAELPQFRSRSCPVAGRLVLFVFRGNNPFLRLLLALLPGYINPFV